MGIGSLGLRAACLPAKAFATAGCRFCRDSLPARRSFSEGWAVRRLGRYRVLCGWGCRGGSGLLAPKRQRAAAVQGDSHAEEALLYGEGDGVGAVGGSEFAHEVSEVGFHGVCGEG